MKILNRMIELSQPISAIALELKLCVQQVQNLAHYVAMIAQNQAHQAHIIQQMWHMQQNIYSKLQSNSLDVTMPSIKDEKKEKPS